MRRQLKNKAIVISIFIVCCIPLLLLWLWYEVFSSI